MRRLCFALVVCSIACAQPEGMMADTEGSSSSGSSGSDTGMTTMGTSVTASTTMSTTATTTNGSATLTTDAVTTADPDTSTSTDATTGECPPGEENCPCDIGSTCTGELMCVDGVCVAAPPCDEPEGEPNDDEASAVMLDEVTCMDMAMTIDGGLNGAESDWFTYHALEGLFCGFGVDPQVSVQADTDLAICVFASCDNGDTTLGCSNGAQDSDSPDGVAGCCDQNSVGINNLDCSGFMTPRDATLWVRITSVDDACMPYTLSWEY